MNEETGLIIRIMHLAYLVQQLTDYCVFISFSGHVNKLDISIRQSKKDWQTKVLESEIYIAYHELRDKSTSSWIAELKAKSQILESVLAEHKIQFDDLDYEEEIRRIYIF